MHAIVQLVVPRRHGAVHLLAALDERSEDRAPRRVRRRRRRWLLAVLATWIQPAIVHHVWIIARHRRRLRGRRAAVARAAHRGAAADRAVARLRRAGRRPGRHGRVLPVARRRRPSSSRTFRMIGASSLEVILGFLTFTGSLMAAGKLQEIKWIPQRPVTYPGQNVSQPRPAASSRWCWACCWCCIPTGRWAPHAFPVDHRAGAAVRRAADHPDRRRRHADRDLDSELLRRPVGRGDGLRARQQAADHRRRARRLQRPDPLDHHVPGDEPLVHQRAVRRVRPGAGRQGAAASRRSTRRKRSKARRRSWSRPAWSSSSPATAWRWPRRSTRSASCTTSSRSAASRSSSPSIPSPAACRAT